MLLIYVNENSITLSFNPQLFHSDTINAHITIHDEPFALVLFDNYRQD